MGCCASKNEEESLEVVLNGRKKCTDPICCCVFIIFWALFLGIFAFGLIFGQPENIIYGIDYKGHSCGDTYYHPGAAEYNCTSDNLCKFVYYPRLSEDATIGVLTNTFAAFGICLPKCPVANQVVCTYEYQNSHGLPSIENLWYCKDAEYNKNHQELCENCWITPLNTTSVIYRCIPMEASIKSSKAVCTIPPSSLDIDSPDYISPDDPRCQAKAVTTTYDSIEPTDIDIITKQLSTLMGFFASLVQDLKNSGIVILIEVVLAIIFGFVFTSFIACCAKFMIWVVLILVILCCILVTVYCYYKGNMLDLTSGLNWLLNFTSEFIDYNVTDVNISVNAIISSNFLGFNQTPETWSIVAYVFTFVSVLVLIMVCALASMVNTSEKIIKETTRSLHKMPLLLFCPVFVAIFCVVIIAFFVISTVLICSSNMSLSKASNYLLDAAAEIIPGANNTVFCRDAITHTNCTILPQYLEGSNTFTWLIGFFNLFGLFWSVEFISGICTMVIAGAVAKWYFTRTNEKGKKPGVGNSTIFESLSCVMRCHLGSIAFGSCCIAIVSVLRSILLYIEKKSKSKDNKLFNCFFKCCHCCLWCLEKCLRYLSKNAYIIVISRNKNFCTACVKSFNLLFQNIGQVTLLNGVTLVFFWLGKILAAVLCGASSYYVLSSLSMFQAKGPTPVYDPIPISLLNALLGYIVFSCFTVVYDASIDTILICYCEDKTYFKEKDQPGYADAQLQDVVNNKSSSKRSNSVAAQPSTSQTEMKTQQQ